MLVGVEADDLALHLHLDRHDLAREAPLKDRAGGAGLAFERERVLFLAGDPDIGRDVFGGDAHVAGTHRAGEGTEHHVHGRGVAHLLPPARPGERVGRA